MRTKRALAGRQGDSVAEWSVCELRVEGYELCPVCHQHIEASLVRVRLLELAGCGLLDVIGVHRLQRQK